MCAHADTSLTLSVQCAAHADAAVSAFRAIGDERQIGDADERQIGDADERQIGDADERQIGDGRSLFGARRAGTMDARTHTRVNAHMHAHVRML